MSNIPSAQDVIDQLAVEGDAVAAAVAQLVVAVIGDLATADAWDLPRRLYLIERHAARAYAGETAFLFGAEKFPLSDRCEDLSGPQYARMLMGMASEMAVLHGPLAAKLAGRDIAGWMLVYEAWTVPLADPGAQEAGDRREIHRHPNRQDARLVLVADRAGGRYQALQIRGDGTIRLAVDRIDGSPPEMAGHLPDALAALAAALP